MADNWKYYNSVKKRLLREKGPDVENLGYNFVCDLERVEGKISLEGRLQPLPGSPDPISDDLFTKIKDDLEKYLKDNQEDVCFNLEYIGTIRAGKE